MLKQYGPGVPEATLRKLVSAFGELRSMADDGLISYPYSTREVVSVVKHMQASALVMLYVLTAESDGLTIRPWLFNLLSISKLFYEITKMYSSIFFGKTTWRNENLCVPVVLIDYTHLC